MMSGFQHHLTQSRCTCRHYNLSDFGLLRNNHLGLQTEIRVYLPYKSLRLSTVKIYSHLFIIFRNISTILYPLDRGLWVGPDSDRYLGLRHVSIDKDAVSILERDDWTESCRTDSLALCKSEEVIFIAPTSCVIEWDTSPGLGVISPSGQAGVPPVLAVPLIYELGARDVSSSPHGRMCTRGAALLSTHEPVVVSPAARVGELCAVPGLLVVTPARVIAQTGALGQGLAAHGDLGLGPTQRLTLTTRQESVSVSETASVLELSVVLNINQFFLGPPSVLGFTAHLQRLVEAS